jgi:uncharacterized protein YggE
MLDAAFVSKRFVSNLLAKLEVLMTWKPLLFGGVAVAVSVAIFFLRGQANQAAPEPTTPQRTITAIGSGTVTGKPDSARLYLGVVTNAKTVAAAREENARVVRQVQAALLALKLPDLKSKTRESNVSIKYDYEDKSRVVGYEVRQFFTVLVTETDPDKLGTTAARILDVALLQGVNSGGEIEFFKADDSEMQRQAMTKAVENGIANAKAYAAGANLKPVGIMEISGQNDFLWGNPSGGGFNGGFGMQGGFGGGGAAPSFVAGDWKVSSQVRVVMRY